MRNNHKKIIFIDGNVASGKSTFLNYFSKSKGDTLIIKEPVTKWFLLTDKTNSSLFQLQITDPKKYASIFQIFVLLTKLKKILSKKESSLVLVDRSFFADFFIFSKNMLDEKNISEFEYKIIHSFYLWCESIIEKLFEQIDRIYFECAFGRNKELFCKREKNKYTSKNIKYLEKWGIEHTKYFSHEKKMNFSTVDIKNKNEIENFLEKIKLFL